MDQLVQNVRAREWAEMIRQQKASNLTVADWCKANNLGTNTFYYRQRKLRRMAVESSPKFVEIKTSDVSSKEVNPVSKDIENSTASIHFGDTLIRLTNDASPELVTAIVKALHAE